MPEYPDVELYLHALRPRVVDRVIDRFGVLGPNVLRTFDPRPSEAESRRVQDVTRLGKRIVFVLEDDLFVVIHPMIAGRLQWKACTAKPPGRPALAWLDLGGDRLVLTEAAKRKRAGIWIVRGEEGLGALDPGGLEVVGSPLADFAAALRRENHTLKRALTDPTLFSGIGNAYSDEILHRARLSPFLRTATVDDRVVERLHAACTEVLTEWRDRLIAEAGDGWPTKVTAFRPGMAVHGRYREPCPVCGSPVQRVLHAESEFDYCATCQTGGKVLADRSLSRLLREDWPRTIDELEERRRS